MEQIHVSCPAFGAGEPIPHVYSQDGKNVSPPLEWSGVPDAATELVLIADDPDAPMAEPFVHWVMYAIPPTTDSLPEGVPKDPTLPTPKDALQGKNTAGNIGYDGPAPPPGHGTHRYHFKLHALDARLDLSPGQSKKDVMAAMEGHVIAQGELVGTYER